jgi:hypothetical protein
LRQPTRPATPAEIAAAGQAELASRGERLTAGQLFPPRVGYAGPAGADLVARALATSARDRPAGGYSPAEGFGVIDPGGALAQAGRLAALRTVAASGPGTVSPAATFATGAAPGTGHSAILAP